MIAVISWALLFLSRPNANLGHEAQINSLYGEGDVRTANVKVGVSGMRYISKVSL